MIGNFDNLFEQLLNALRTSEKRHREVRDNASDHSDWNTYDSEGDTISNIIKWRRHLEPLRSEIVASGAVADEDVSYTYNASAAQGAKNNDDHIAAQAEPLLEADDEIKVGKYIREKLRDLSQSGFVFTSEQIRQLCDASSSKRIFTYPLLQPFAKKYTDQHDLSTQTKDENGKNRYWNEIFKFGDIDLLIISQWYATDKESFDRWYDSLLQTKTIIADNTLIFKKTVDWSTLNYGITIPVDNWALFFNAIGQTIAAGDSCDIAVEIRDSEGGDFKAAVIHTASGATKTLQIRYTQASKIVSVLRRVFKNSFDFLDNERNSNNENTRVVIPPNLEEYISVYATGTPNLLRFVCSPLKPTTLATSATAAQTSVLIHAKQQYIGENIVEVSSSYVPILSFPSKGVVICAKLLVETQQVLFRAEVQGLPYKEKAFEIDYLKEIALLKSGERIHRIAVPESVNTSKLMMFMAWIDPLESSVQVEAQEVMQPTPERTTINNKPTNLTLFSKDYAVGAWNELLVKVCEVMLLHKPYIMAAMDRDTELNAENRTYFSYIQSDIKVNGKRLTNGLWVETDMNRQETLKISHRLLEKCGFSPNEMQIETLEDV